MAEERARNWQGWYLTFCSRPTDGRCGWDSPVEAAKAAITMLEADLAAGVKKWLAPDVGGAREYSMWTQYLQARGIEVHFACSDEYFGYEDVFMSVYNNVALISGCCGVDPVLDLRTWKIRTGLVQDAWGYVDDVLVEERKKYQAMFDEHDAEIKRQVAAERDKVIR